MKVLVVDDHPIIREGIRLLIAQEFLDLELLQAGSLADAEAAVVRESGIRLVLLDLGLPDADGLSALAALRSLCLDAAIVVFSAETMPDLMMSAIDGGAAGFIPKTMNASDMLAALRCVLAGEIYLPVELLPRTRLDHSNARELLTSRQLEVLSLLVQGNPNKLICRKLGMSESTVKTHLATIFQKLQVGSRTQAVIAAARAGLRLPKPTSTRV